MPSTSKIPENYQDVMPYLIVKGASAFAAFTATVFNAKQTYGVMRDENIVMHAEIMIGASTIMFADATDTYPPRPAGMFVYVSNADETYQKALEAGATAISPLSDQPYGRSGGVEDPFGNTWWITSILPI